MTIPAQVQPKPPLPADRSFGRSARRSKARRARPRLRPLPVAIRARRFGFWDWAGRVGWLIIMAYALVAVVTTVTRYGL